MMVGVSKASSDAGEVCKKPVVPRVESRLICGHDSHSTARQVRGFVYDVANGELREVTRD